MNEFIFSNKSKTTFLKLAHDEQNRIVEKLKFLKSHNNILASIKRIQYMEPVTHRLRIGQIRLLLQLISRTKEKFVFRIVKIAHRREVYR